MNIYPLYLDTNVRVTFTLGSWYQIYTHCFAMRNHCNKMFNENLFKLLLNTSFIVFLTNGLWIAMTILCIVDQEKLRLGIGADEWWHNYYLVSIAGVIGAELMCFLLYLTMARAKSQVEHLSNLILKNYN